METLVQSEAMPRQLGESIKPKNLVLDPRMPEIPEEVVGLNTDAVLRLGSTLSLMGVLPYEAHKAVRKMPDAVRILPLIERMQSQEQPLDPEEIRPYRKPIKRAVGGKLYAADKLFAVPLAVGVSRPRKYINSRIEAEFQERTEAQLESAREVLTVVEKEAEKLAEFDYPREQFEFELSQIAKTTKAAIVRERDIRVGSGGHVEEIAPPNKAFGFFNRVVDKVKSFFGIFSRRKRSVNTEITAYDAARGIDHTFNKLLSDKQAYREKIPLISNMLLSRIPNKTLPHLEYIALLAPEILTSLFSALPEEEKDHGLVQSVIRNPHNLRFLTRFFGKDKIARYQRVARNLLPNIRDVLPTDSEKIKGSLAKAKFLLGVK